MLGLGRHDLTRDTDYGNHDFLKTAIRLVFVPLKLLSPPQQFAVFVNFWWFMRTN
jgi:hypothetical protein